MVFNIASGSLIYSAYQANSTNPGLVTSTEYGLSITELVLLSVFLYILITASKDKNVVVFNIYLLTVEVFNIVYSAYVINYYNNKTVIDSVLNNMSLAIIILNSLNLCNCIGYHQIFKKVPEKTTVFKEEQRIFNLVKGDIDYVHRQNRERANIMLAQV